MDIKQGHIIDEHCNIKGTIVEYNGKIYSCVLNQTDIVSNKNKFYIMQLIKNNSTYVHFIRYGRISETGKITYKSYSSEATGRLNFEKQFRLKTGNSFFAENFVKKDGKYFISNVSYETEFKNIPTNPITIPNSKLPEQTQKLITMLSDINMLSNTLVSLDIDTKKLPLGKINKSQIDMANKVLDNINNLINSNTMDLTDQLIKLSSEYYTLIPYSCGRKKPPVINDISTVGKYREILTELENIVITVQIKENIKPDENPIDSIYNDINTKIVPLDRADKMWSEIEQYISNTHGPTHSAKLQVMDIFEIEQNNKKPSDINNKTLLFHGTSQNCVLSIFKRDFYLDPSKLNDVNVQVTGKMFGYGVYFADCCTKSFNYTRAHDTNNIGCFIMAEVALGKQLELTDANYSLNQNILEASNYNSTKGVGKWEPSSTTIINDIKVPNGQLYIKNNKTSLLYNEYIVYNIDQILIKYLVVVKNK